LISWGELLDAARAILARALLLHHFIYDENSHVSLLVDA
jgi:hypothetical protein